MDHEIEELGDLRLKAPRLAGGLVFAHGDLPGSCEKSARDIAALRPAFKGTAMVPLPVKRGRGTMRSMVERVAAAGRVGLGAPSAALLGAEKDLASARLAKGKLSGD